MYDEKKMINQEELENVSGGLGYNSSDKAQRNEVELEQRLIDDKEILGKGRARARANGIQPF